MVEVKKIQSLYFSPTGNIKKIVEEVAKGTELPIVQSLDLTTPIQRDAWSGNYEGDLLLVGDQCMEAPSPRSYFHHLKNSEEKEN